MPIIKPKFRLSIDPWLYPWYWRVFLFIPLALVTVGIWWLSLNPDQFLRPPPNRPPVAATIFIEVAAGEAVAVDIREYIHDPDGAPPRLLGCEFPQFGVVERVDDYHFRYSAPPRNFGADIFLYWIVDDSGAEGEGWVFINGDPPVQD